MLERIFAPASVDSLFSDAAMLAAMARFERALAQAQASIGLVPDSAAQAIGRACNELGDPSATDDSDVLTGGRFDPAKLYPAARNSGTLVIPFLKALREQVATVDPEAVRFLHHGSTSQDVIDSALAMQCKEAGRRLLDALERTGAALCVLAQAHRGTMMVGRTLLQPAAPIPFGWKAAGWLEPLTRSRRHLRTALLDSAVLQFGGAVGTLSGQNLSPEQSHAVAQRLADALGLLKPAASWHTSRDRFARLGSEIAILCGCLGKIGGDVALMMQSEVAEAFEPAGLRPGRLLGDAAQAQPGGRPADARSSATRARARRHAGRRPGHRARGVVWANGNRHGGPCAPCSAAPPARSRRPRKCSAACRSTPKACRPTSTACTASSIRSPWQRTSRPSSARTRRRRWCSELCETALAKGMSLRQVLGRDARISAVMNLGDLERLFDPESQLGVSGPMIDQVLAAWRSSR